MPAEHQNERKVRRLEKMMGFKYKDSISKIRQNDLCPPVRALLKGIGKLREPFGHLRGKALRESKEFKEKVTILFETHAPYLWTALDQERSAWLVHAPDTEGYYPEDLYYKNNEHRAKLHRHFHNLIRLKVEIYGKHHTYVRDPVSREETTAHALRLVTREREIQGYASRRACSPDRRESKKQCLSDAHADGSMAPQPPETDSAMSDSTNAAAPPSNLIEAAAENDSVASQPPEADSAALESANAAPQPHDLTGALEDDSVASQLRVTDSTVPSSLANAAPQTEPVLIESIPTPVEHAQETEQPAVPTIRPVPATNQSRNDSPQEVDEPAATCRDTIQSPTVHVPNLAKSAGPSSNHDKWALYHTMKPMYSPPARVSSDRRSHARAQLAFPSSSRSGDSVKVIDLTGEDDEQEGSTTEQLHGGAPDIDPGPERLLQSLFSRGTTPFAPFTWHDEKPNLSPAEPVPTRNWAMMEVFWEGNTVKSLISLSRCKTYRAFFGQLREHQPAETKGRVIEHVDIELSDDENVGVLEGLKFRVRATENDEEYYYLLECLRRCTTSETPVLHARVRLEDCKPAFDLTA